MGELLKLNNIGIQGLSTDPQAWSLPPEFITFGRNFRIFAGAIISSGGSRLWSTPPVNFNPSHPFHVGATSGDFWLIAGRSAVYVFDGQNWFDVSSTIGYSNIGADDELRWSSCGLGAIPILSNPQAQPEFWAPQELGQILQPLPFDQAFTWKDKGITAEVFRSHKNFLFALNLFENGQELPDSYRWSHPADVNGLPATWDETDDAFLAGKAALGGDYGRIIDGASLRDAFCIYSETGINILDSTNDEFVWRRRELSATSGLLARNCVVEVKGTHFFLSDGDIISNNGNEIKSIAHNRIRRELTSRIDIDNFTRSYAVRQDALKEVWFCIPDSGASYPTIAYIYNWRDDSWAIRDIPENISFAGYGSQSEAVDGWDDLANDETWEVQGRVWGSANTTPLDDTIVGANPVDGNLILMDPSGNPDEDVNARIERTDFPLIDEREVTTITRVYPNMLGQGDLSIQFGSQDYPGAPVRWKPAVVFDPNAERKIDLRTTGELHCWRFESLGKTDWKMSGFAIEFERSGKR